MKYLYIVIGGILSLAAFYLTFRNVPFNSIWTYFLSIDYFWVFISIVINFSSFLIRAYRWQLIVNQIHSIRFCAAYHPMAIGFMMNSILPGRLGEVVRPMVLNKKQGIPISTGLTTVITERLFDILILCLLYVFVLLFVQIDPDYQMEIGNYILSQSLLESIAINVSRLLLVIIVCIALFCMSWSRLIITNTLQQIPKLLFFFNTETKNIIGNKCIQPIIHLIDHIAKGFSFFNRPLIVIYCFILSITIWGLVAYSNYVMTFGCKNLNIGFFEMLAVMVIICFFITLPAVPGYWGIWEAGGIFALTIFGIGIQEATGFTIVNHAAQLLPIILAGFISALITGTSILSSKKLNLEDQTI